MSTTTHKTRVEETPAKENLRPFVWLTGAVYLLKDARTMGLTELDEGLASFLERGEYQRLPGGIEPLETWVSDTSPNHYCIVARYGPYFGNVTLVFLIQDDGGYGAFTEKYGPRAAALPRYVLLKPAQAPSNVATAYPWASGRW